MSIQTLNKWAELLLDMGKRNNLISFKNTKLSTVELVAPDFATLFSYADKGAKIKVFDPKIEDEDSELDFGGSDLDADGGKKEKLCDRDDYIAVYSGRIKKGQVLAYNITGKPIKALTNITKKVKTTIEETGVNTLYLTFGFINWTENASENVMKAPLLLVPVSVSRESAVEPYEIKIPNDEMILNPTFSFKLYNDYGIKLPEFEDGDDVDTYIESVSDMIKGLGWTVSLECMLGLFSFQKLNMYQDIKDNSDFINNNANIRAIMGESVLDLSSVTDDEEEVETPELYNVIDADSSQLEAIEMAKRGVSFVLQGPPGTGKSQTITNILAETIADGKTALFVSEKMAALDVVYEKLKRAGLSEFCLELHSHKTNKKQVIEELCHTLKAAKSALSDKADREVAIKKKAQKDLDSYADELHRIYPVINKSLFDIYLEVAACRKAPELEMAIDDIGSKGIAYMDKAEELLEKYIGYIGAVGYDYRQNPWYGFRNYDLSYQTKVQLKADLKLAVDFSNIIKLLSMSIIERHGISLDTVDEYVRYDELFSLLSSTKFITPQLLGEENLADIIEKVRRMRELSKIITEKKEMLDAVYDPEIFDYDGVGLHKQLTRRFNSLGSRLFGKDYKKLIGELRLLRKDGKKPKYKRLVEEADALRIYRESKAEFETAEGKIYALLGNGYKGLASDFDSFIRELAIVEAAKNTGCGFGTISSFTDDEFEEKRSSFARTANEIHDAFEVMANAVDRLSEQFDGCDLKTMPLLDFDEKINYCNDNIEQVDSWNELMGLFDTMSELKIKDNLDCMLDHTVEAGLITTTLKRTFYTQWADYIIRTVPVLSGLNRSAHDDTVERFCEKDLIDFEINKAKIKANVSSKRPALDLVAQGSAVATLLREGEKKSKQKSIRQLLHDIGDLALTLKPCFLMSPLSVSTFLDANMKFDLVIFDEASQIFPQDAIGAIYRGKQLIVVGDSKQMPPSNFFASSVTEVEEEEEDENDNLSDYESILDICSAAFAQRRLKWHYRSRFEELISFSNKNYYENDLVTFPSPRKKEEGVGVDYIHVDGVFDRKSKTNKAEAERVVELVLEHIEKYPERSLGVVAFSISQQSLIEKLINKKLREDPSLNDFFTADKPEPFFVKNLETVQGDERDTIIFSIAYAKDTQGKFIYNFGPLNKKGGERRLNVAVTRAKYNVKLVTSLHAAELDLSHTNSVGVRCLRDYLAYAEFGVSALESEEIEKDSGYYASDLDKEVCEFLLENGYVADTKVGCSSFKIDIALKSPEGDGYLLAIECDGASYHSSKNTRDRDRLRQTVLENMGWRYYRIWSTDWFRNKKAEKEKLLAAISDAIENKPMRAHSSTDFTEKFEVKAYEKHFEFPRYRTVNVKSIQSQCGYHVLKIVRNVLELEAPLSEEWLLKRLVHLYRHERVNSVVCELFEKDMAMCKQAGIVRKNGFMYLKDREIPILRVPEDDATPREIQYISDEELALGMRIILRENITVERMGLYRSISQKLGYSRLGDNIIAKLESALVLLNNDIEINDDIITLKRGR